MLIQAVVAPLNPNASAIVGTVDWVQGLLTGTLSTSIAVLAIAGLGYEMLHGRLSVRRGMRVVLGCFILFGAPSIAQALAGIGRESGEPAQLESAPPPPAPKMPPQPDPYAGASVPM